MTFFSNTKTENLALLWKPLINPSIKQKKKINRSRAKVWGDVFMFTLTAKSEELRIQSVSQDGSWKGRVTVKAILHLHQSGEYLLEQD